MNKDQFLGLVLIGLLVALYYVPFENFMVVNKQFENSQIYIKPYSNKTYRCIANEQWYVEKPHFGHGVVNGLLIIPIAVQHEFHYIVTKEWDSTVDSWHKFKTACEEKRYECFEKGDPWQITITFFRGPKFLIWLIFHSIFSFIAWFFWAILYLLISFFSYLWAQFVTIPLLMFQIGGNWNYYFGLILVIIISVILHYLLFFCNHQE